MNPKGHSGQKASSRVPHSEVACCVQNLGIFQVLVAIFLYSYFFSELHADCSTCHPELKDSSDSVIDGMPALPDLQESRVQMSDGILELRQNVQ